MATTERFSSQSMHITAEGTVATRIFDCDWGDWPSDLGPPTAAGAVQSFPQIGDAFFDRVDCVCSDIRVTWPDNAHCQVVCTYSTLADEAEQAVPNEVSSWEASFSFSLEEENITEGFEGQFTVYEEDLQGRTKWPGWTAFWLEQGDDYTKENIPQLIQKMPRMFFTLTIYGSALYLNNAMDSIGTVNNADFMKEWAATVSAQKVLFITDITGDDTGKWLFLGMRIDKVRADSWKYEMHFEYNKNFWNQQHGLYIPMYPTTDFGAFSAGMNEVNDIRNTDQRGS